MDFQMCPTEFIFQEYLFICQKGKGTVFPGHAIQGAVVEDEWLNFHAPSAAPQE